MQPVIDTLQREIPDAEIDYQASGSRLVLHVVSSVFKTMNRLERQRFVKKILTPWIESGALHAVNLTTGVKDE